MTASPPGALIAAVTVRRGTFTLDATIEVVPGEVLAVLGPNGAGKSTLLAVLAGLIQPDAGSVHLGGRLLTGPHHFVEPAERRVGLMGQDPLLFPHLTAAENIAFGPRSQRVSRRDSRARARIWLERLAVEEFADSRPAQLSGGQRQRVALARALAAGPELLLLDEPLGAVDAQTAPEIRQVLRTHIRAAGAPTILVTHDVLDAATLADRVVVLDGGQVVESGATARVLAMPRSAFSAAMAGLNIVTGMTESAAEPGSPVALAGGRTALDPAGPAGAGHITGIAAERLAAHAAATAVFAPSAVAVYLAPTGTGSPRNMWPAAVVALEQSASAVRVRAQAEDGPAAGLGTVAADLTPAAIADLRLEPGARVYLSVKATEVRVHTR